MSSTNGSTNKRTSTTLEEAPYIADKRSNYTPTIKAYKNADFLASHPARNIRILCELEETSARLQAHNVRATILFFGSARAKSSSQFAYELAEMESSITGCQDTAQKSQLEEKLKTLKSLEWMCEQYDTVSDLSRRLTTWACNPTAHLNKHSQITGVARENQASIAGALNSIQLKGHNTDKDHHDQSLFVITGGGPGFMKAANEGAARVQGSRNIGMAISLPFEKGTNEHVSTDLAFEFHYFFTRKFWMVYHCQALIVAPGGMGTLDELFEVLTLKQTGKVQKDLPVVLIGKEFWKTIINWEALFKFGTISRKDVDDLVFTDSAEEAEKYIISRLSASS